LFIAAYPPPEVRAHLGEMVGRLAVARPMPPGRSVRLATPERWHMTVAFLGEVPDERADDAGEVLRELAIGAPTVRIAGGGRFGRGKFTTLVAGVRDESAARPVHDESAARPADGEPAARSVRGESGEPGVADSGMAELGDAVRKGLRRRKLPFDHRPLQPHVTLARPGDRLPAVDLAADLQILDGYEGPPWIVDELQLVRSFLGPTPDYEMLTTVTLPR
jgi:2'-5' RNA ligase